MNIKIRVLNENFLYDIKEAALNTVNKKTITTESFSPELLIKYLVSEHSPIRCAILRITMEDIPYPSSVHFARHVHSLHFVSTRRPDRTGQERDQNKLVTHIMDCNLQALIDMSRKRLCIGKVEKDTYLIMKEIKDQLILSNDIYLKTIGEALVPNGIYRKHCPEFSSCGYCEEGAH